jgi:hypothetical protein
MLGSADQLAAIFGWTDLGLAMVCRHEKLEGHTLKASHLRSVGPHQQAFANFFRTRGHREVKTVDLHKAQPARGVGMLPGLDKAHIGNKDGVLETRLKNGFSLFHLDFFVVDYQIDHSYSCLNLIRYTCSVAMAVVFDQSLVSFFSGARSIMGASSGGETFSTASYSGGQTTIHSPHLTHNSWSIAFFLPVVVKMASTGQQPTQTSHPRAHFSRSM